VPEPLLRHLQWRLLHHLWITQTAQQRIHFESHCGIGIFISTLFVVLLYAQTSKYCKREIRRLSGKETNQVETPSKSNNSKVPGSNANPIIPDGEETPETSAHSTKRKRATISAADRKLKRTHAAKQREDRNKIQANKARMEAAANAAAIESAKKT